MLYREFGKTKELLSILGFGAMRLPLIDGDDSKIDESKAIPMVRHAIDAGVNYLDTAYPYHGGNSEAFCAKVMKDGYRKKVNIATKLPVWDVKLQEDMYRLLDEQLGNLEVNVIDFYLLHALKDSWWETMKACDYKTFLDTAKAEGKIRYAGFSFHDNIELFKEIVDDYEWDFCQIQLNYLDNHYQAGLEGLRYAASKGLGVIVMEPLRGGMLSRTELPKEVAAKFDSNPIKRTPSEWALRWVFDQPEVGVVLSGMTQMSHVTENLKTASKAYPRSLSEKENKIIENVQTFYNDRIIVNCTNCRYCMPCPAGVEIPESFWAYNHDAIFDDPGKADFWINGWLGDEKKPSNCIDCGACESHCPQHIDIRKHLKIIAEKYETKNS